jgi:hypothetical protein
MYRVRSTGEIKNASEIRAMNPNVSMPQKFTTVTCDALGIDLVKPSARPEPTGTYKKVIKNGYEQVNGSWQVAWSEVDMFTANDSQTKAEQETAYQSELDAEKAADVRNQRNGLLTSSDWTQVDDSQVDKAAWAIYRQALRDITAHADFPNLADAAWPTEP